MKVTVTQWMQVTMIKTVEIPEGVTSEIQAKDYAYEHGQWSIAKIHDTECAECEVDYT